MSFTISGLTCKSLIKSLTPHRDLANAVWGRSGFHKMPVEEPLELPPSERKTFYYIWETSGVQ